jgi:lipopolysaccharide/colanic/teichoic acid biosynthesis glycosyltransferase
MLDDSSVSDARHNGVADTRTTHAALTETKVHQVVWRQHGAHEGETPAPRRAPTTWYLPCKVTLEYAIALVLFALSVPVILFTALLVKLTSRGPIFYSQVRLGKDGRPFRLYKIRTMTHNCEKTSGPRWSTPGDPRITPVGHYLRQTHLDELPQLWNVLRGEMGLVGPRPERPEFVPSLEQALPHYRDRLQVRPGVTGLAQVQQPADTDLASVRRKLAYDLYYLRHMNLWLDLRLILCTGVRMVGLPFHLLGWVFCLPRREVVEKHYRARETQARPVLCLQPLS